MDYCKKENRKTNPRERANIISLLSFSYMLGLLRRAFKRDLEVDDLYEVMGSCKSQRCGGKLESHWLNEREKKRKKEKPLSIKKMMWNRWGKRYLFVGTVDFLYATFNSVFRPFALSKVVSYFTPGQNVITREELYVYAFLYMAQNLIKIVYVHNYIIWVETLGIEIKTAFSSLLYRKALKLTPAALSEISTGNIVNLITKDVNIFQRSIWVFNDTWISTTQILVVCYLLYINVGWISFTGIGILLTALPLQVYIGNKVTSLRLQTGKKTDERLELMQEILSTMRVIKMYAWEAFFAKNITYARRKEVSKILFGLYFKIVLVLIGSLFSKFGFYILIMASLWFGVTTNTSLLFYALSNFKDLRYHLGIVLPYSLGQFGEFKSSYRRIFNALEAEELCPDHQDDKPTEKPLVSFEKATVVIRDVKILDNITFTATSGLLLITGAVGSGKTSILKAILQDYPLKSGLLKRQGRIAYASQDPWLFPSTIKQNILFGEEYNEKRYREVVRVCALLFDFNLFEKGDETIVTDRGLNLSKGQQARINLARAIYRDSDIYLLDDCLTALDSAVQDFIFKNCIKSFLKDKLCILVSQTLAHVGEADNVLVMHEGCIKKITVPSEILSETLTITEDIIKDVDSDVKGTVNLEEATEESALIETEQISAQKKIYHEDKKVGAVGFQVYLIYFMYGGGLLLLFCNLFLGGITQFSISYSDKMLTKWIDEKQNVLNIEENMTATMNSTFFANNTLLNDAKYTESSTLRMYSILLMIGGTLELIATFLGMDFCRRASANIHKDMINKILHSVMSFFDSHLIGNVLNRFSQDLANIDEYLPFVLTDLYSATFTIIGSIVLIVSVNVIFSAFILFVFVILLVLRRFYMPAGRSLKRLEASSRSPMVGHLNATLEGLTTIRACKVEDLLIEEYDRHQDLYTSAHYLSTCSNRALGFFMDTICTSITLVVITRFVFFDTASTAGDIGLALTQVISLGRHIEWCLRQWVELENLMTSVERLKEYTEIKTERRDGAVVENWPSNGGIAYNKVSLSYNRTDDYVLKGVNFQVAPKEKIGIVGRTGAGKSSIIATIFRLYEVEGIITIDDIDIKTVSIQLLRRSIAIIPQDPVLFAGTIRSNLDPLDEFEDDFIWETLETVGMKKSITSLHQIVNGLHFSSGQKQLICLSRAIMRKNKIVIMDEATANMDPETDEILHDIIRKNFADSTVLIIAHRLHSIMSSDKVMVLDRGEIKEFDRPRILINDTTSLFYNMVKQSDMLDYFEKERK